MRQSAHAPYPRRSSQSAWEHSLYWASGDRTLRRYCQDERPRFHRRDRLLVRGWAFVYGGVSVSQGTSVARSTGTGTASRTRTERVSLGGRATSRIEQTKGCLEMQVIGVDVAGISVVVSVVALSVSAFVAWYTLLRRGAVRMTRPTTVFFGTDNANRDGGENRKVDLRTLLY